jgi:hypothetical protein
VKPGILPKPGFLNLDAGEGIVRAKAGKMAALGSVSLHPTYEKMAAFVRCALRTLLL